MYSEKLMTSFFTCDFLKFYASYKKTDDIYRILRKFSARNICFLCKNTDLKIWPDLGLTSVKSQRWHHRMKWLSPSISACKMTQKTCVTRHVCDLYFRVTSCDLTSTLTFLCISFILLQYPSWTFTRHFGWVWALCISSNRPRTPKCENASVWHLTWPGPDTWP